MKFDFSNIRLEPLSERRSLVSSADLREPPEELPSLLPFIESLPPFLAANDFRIILNDWKKAVLSGKKIIFSFGAHVLKVALGPYLADLAERGFINHLATNGAAAVHDIELAIAGHTSEDVADTLPRGMFGMARETGEFYSRAARHARKTGCGLGRAIGELLIEERAPFLEKSLFARARKCNVAITVHIGFGTDIVHTHPAFDPEAFGRATYDDFRIFTGAVAELERGVYFNVGSAVIMPEVFLKALSAARNCGYPVRDFTAINLDMIKHYRPTVNVVSRPTSGCGRGINITGHHELMIPLLHWGIISLMEEAGKSELSSS